MIRYVLAVGVMIVLIVVWLNLGRLYYESKAAMADFRCEVLNDFRYCDYWKYGKWKGCKNKECK